MLLKEKVYSQLAYLVKKIRFLEAILVSGLSLYILFLDKNAASRIFNEKKLDHAVVYFWHIWVKCFHARFPFPFLIRAHKDVHCNKISAKSRSS